MPQYSRITGTGSYLPPRRVTNQQLVEQLAQRGVETSDQWIVERTGIQARHFADDGVFSSDLAVHAARQALEAANCQAGDIDLIIVATSTPDMVFPSTASIVQHKLGIAGCPAFDVQAVCTGFIYALTVADSPGALDAGVMLNMDSASGRISFAANLAAARRQGLGLSARLLNLATEVRQ